MSDGSWEQDPQQQSQIDGVIEGAERLLQDAADHSRMQNRRFMLELNSSAEFARAAVNALQTEQGCFDQSTMNEVMRLDDVTLQASLPQEVTRAASQGDTPSDRDALLGFAGGLAGLYNLLTSDVIRDETSNHDLIVNASHLYNNTFGCLAILVPNEEPFERTSGDLEFYLAPLTVGVLEFNEEGLAVPPERAVSAQDAVHDEFEQRIRDVLPAHDSNARFLVATVFWVNQRVESLQGLLRESIPIDSVADFIDMAIDTHVRSYREKLYSHMSDQTAAELSELIHQYLDSMLDSFNQSDHPD